MKRRYSPSFILALIILAAVSAMGTLWSSEDKFYSALEKAFYLTAEDAVWIRPGLHFEIQNVTIPESPERVNDFETSATRI